MKISEADVLILPGIGNSGPGHWQRRWAERFSTGRIVEQDARIAMIGVIVVRPVPEHDVCLPLANQPRNGFSVLERRHQFAVVNIEHFGLDPEYARAYAGVADTC